MTRQQKFQFIPAYQINKPKEAAKILVAFNPSIKLLAFNQKENPEVSSYKGKHVQLFVDIEKKTLAWTFAPQEWTKPEELKNFDPIRAYPKSTGGEVICIYVPKNVCEALKMDKKFKRAEVQTYKPAEYLDNNLYYYINIKDIYESQEKA